MKLHLCLSGILVAVTAALAPFATAQEKTDENPPTETAPQVNRLNVEEQLKLRAAQQKALEDPELQAAIAKRNQAVEAFRAALHKSMVKGDPAMEAILAKIAVGNSPGF